MADRAAAHRHVRGRHRPPHLLSRRHVGTQGSRRPARRELRRHVADTVSLRGELRVVDHVPRAFPALVVEEAPESLALSGGSTARECYELLAVADVDWSEVDVFFGDERWGPGHDPESNEGMARQAFADQVHPRTVYSMRHAGNTIEEAADAYDR